MSSDAACDSPPLPARTTDFIGPFWPEYQSIHFPITTTMPLSFASDSSHSRGSQLSSNSGHSASPSTGSVTTVLEDPGYDPSLEGKDETTAQNDQHTGTRETSLPLTPYPGSAPQLSGAFVGWSGVGHGTRSFVRTALPLLMRNDAIDRLSASAGAPNPLASTLARDSLLIYAHQFFSSFPNSGSSGLVSHSPASFTSPDHPYNNQLLPLLQRLRILHPNHIPILLLLGCVYYAVGDFQESLAVNEEILRIDENFVEAMSNMGTTLKAMGRAEDAIQWWWKAVYLRPDYWDAVNNLLGALVAEEQNCTEPAANRTYSEPLRLCETVQSRLISRDGELLVSILPRDLLHLQNVFYVSGSIRCMSGQSPHYDAMRDFVSSIETLLHLRESATVARYDFKHLLLAGSVSGFIIDSRLPEAIARLASNMGYPELSRLTDLESFDLLEFVKRGDDTLWQLIAAEGDGTFPPIFASPEQALNISRTVFRSSFGVFPSLCSWSEAEERLGKPGDDVIIRACELASNVLLGIAKLVQESNSATICIPRFNKWIHVGPSLTSLLYYLAYSVFPSPSSCNNLGIVLSSTPWMDTRASGALNLAKAFYKKGLELDPSHAHILTNMGSLMKEVGDLSAAIDLYSRAIQANPAFDVALANLANALKDSGRLSESVSLYRRAIEVNDELSEALCGLAHAAWSICDWRGFGFIDNSVMIDAEGDIIKGDDSRSEIESGWMPKLIRTTQKQLTAAYSQNVGLVEMTGSIEEWIAWIEESIGMKLLPQQRSRWLSYLQPFFSRSGDDRQGLCEGGFAIRVIEWLTRHLQWKWYINTFGNVAFTPTKLNTFNADAIRSSGSMYSRPHLPPSMSVQLTPSVLPFHTFIYPLSAREIRLVAHRNAIRVSHSALTCSWHPEHVHPPPPPPGPRINVGYISSDFIDHPTAHLISSVFGMHDATRFSIFVYATKQSDGSTYREKIEQEAETFRDVSGWTTQAIVEEITADGIHILVNLNGYTKGARNDIFAARPCPLQISFLGFAGTLASGWCDYLLCDPIACPPTTRTCEFCDLQESVSQSSSEPNLDTPEPFEFDLGPDPESMGEWKYMERLIYMPHTYLVTDHKQYYGVEARGLSGSAAEPDERWEEVEDIRRQLRRKLFPDIIDDTIIFANFNQMYKLDPSIFLTWLRILQRVPNSILWLLRFPPAGEEHLLRTALQWADPDVASSRVRFTDVVTKDEHIERVSVADIFLDTVECNAHTVAADVLWGGTPIITWPKYTFKMCSRVGASIAFATGFGHQMVVDSLAAYEERAVSLALSITWSSFGRSGAGERRGELADLRRNLFMNRERMPLFDCQRWTSNLEKGYIEAWKRWVRGGTTTHFNVEGGPRHQYEHCSGFIWIRDEDT